MDPSQEIALEIPGFLRIFKDGRVHRFIGTDRVPASVVDPHTGVSSKDVIIDQETGLSARLYLPPFLAVPDEPRRKFPLLIYIHGGGFCVESAFAEVYHRYLNSLVYKSYAIAVSVEYRLAPEHPVPAAHLDCWAVLQWVARQFSGPEVEQWIAEYADLDRLFIAGDSAGANIVHHCAMMAGGRSEIFGSGLGKCHPIRIKGIILVHPYFWSSVCLRGDSPEAVAFVEKFWKAACASSPGFDDPILNPLAVGSPALSSLGCRMALVALAGDMFRERGWMYYEALKGSGWKGEVEVTEDEGEGHVFHLLNPESEKAKQLLKRLGSFINRD